MFPVKSAIVSLKRAVTPMKQEQLDQLNAIQQRQSALQDRMKLLRAELLSEASASEDPSSHPGKARRFACSKTLTHLIKNLFGERYKNISIDPVEGLLNYQFDDSLKNPLSAAVRDARKRMSLQAAQISRVEKTSRHEAASAGSAPNPHSARTSVNTDPTLRPSQNAQHLPAGNSEPHQRTHHYA